MIQTTDKESEDVDLVVTKPVTLEMLQHALRKVIEKPQKTQPRWDTIC